MRAFQLAAVVGVLIACGVTATHAAPATGVGNLGDSLLDGDLARSLSSKPAAENDDKRPAADQPGASWLPNQEMLRRLLQDDTGVVNENVGGEDVGGSPLASVVSGMQRAEAYLSDDRSEKAAVPVQREVVAELDKLIAQMEKACQSCKACSGSKPGDKKKQASKRSQSKPGDCDKEGQCDKPGQKPGKKAGQKANQSGTTTLAGAPAAATPEEQQALMKAAWGHLPERMRERMLQGAGSEFLPEYREELQQYYRKLAERNAREKP